MAQKATQRGIIRVSKFYVWHPRKKKPGKDNIKNKKKMWFEIMHGCGFRGPTFYGGGSYCTKCRTDFKGIKY